MTHQMPPPIAGCKGSTPQHTPKRSTVDQPRAYYRFSLQLTVYVFQKMAAIDRGSSLRNRRRYKLPTKFLPKANLRNLLLGLIVFFLLRAFFFTGYRKDVMENLSAQGPEGGELEHVIAKSSEERKEYVNGHGPKDVDKMKHDITYLLNEVHNLRAKAQQNPTGGDKPGSADRQMGLKEMDHRHMQRRKQNEEKLLKEHPDFVPSRGVKGAEKA